MAAEIMNKAPEQPDGLIRVTYQDDRLVVSARELHILLEVKTAYKDWFPRMCEYGFTEGQDFCPFLSESTGGRPAQDAIITVDMAKEICMIQRNEKGKAVRQYFLQLEKDWNSPDKLMARALLLADKKIKLLEEKIEADAPAVAFANDIALSKDAIAIEEFTKSLFDLHGIRVGRNRMFRLLRDMKILRENNLPYQKYLENGWFQVRSVVKNGVIRYQTLICGKGQQKIYELLKARYFKDVTLEQGNTLLAGA